MNYLFKTVLALTIALAMIGGCSTAPSTSHARSELISEARGTVAKFRQTDPTMERFFSSAVGYAVFPSIGKGGLVVGGAFGRGALFEGNTFTSYCDMTQGTIGLQIGGQAYSEIIFFQNQNSLRDFKNGTMAFTAEVSAVAATYGAAAGRDYSDGVAVFVGDQAGLMAEASVGGQKFSVIPANDEMFAGDPRVGTTGDDNYSVYGYPDDQDPGWRHDSTYNHQYDVTRPRTIRGEVIGISEFSPTRNSQVGRQITIRGDDGQTHAVHLGPAAFLDRENQLLIRNGDIVTVHGSSTRFDGGDVILAREVIGTDNRRLELRDQNGRSLWNRQPNGEPAGR